MADGKDLTSGGGRPGGAAGGPSPAPPVSPSTAIVTTPIAMATTGMAMGTPTLLTISNVVTEVDLGFQNGSKKHNSAINIKAATGATSGNGQKTPEGATGQTVSTLVRAPVTALAGPFPRLPLFTPQQGTPVNLRIPNPAGAAFNFRVAPRGAVMLNTRSLGPGGAHIIPQVLPQGTKIVSSPQLGNGGQVTQTLMAKVKPGQPLKIGMTLPVSAAAAAQGMPIPSTMALTVPIQVAVPVTAVPAQGTLTSLTSLATLPFTMTAAPSTVVGAAGGVVTPQKNPMDGLVSTNTSSTPQLSIPQPPQILPLNGNNKVVTAYPIKENNNVANALVPPSTVSSASFTPSTPTTGTTAIPIAPSKPANTPTPTPASLPSPTAAAQAPASTSNTPVAGGDLTSETKPDPTSTKAAAPSSSPPSTSPPAKTLSPPTKDEPKTENETVAKADTVATSNEDKMDVTVEKEEAKDKVLETPGEENKTSDTPSADPFDPMKVLDWSNGIGSLPGSSLKFRVNEFGLMEVVTDELENTDTTTEIKQENTSSNDDTTSQRQSPTSANGQEPIPEPDQEMAHTLTPAAAAALNAAEGSDTKIPPSLCQCENCGVYGMINEFCGGGRFCSKTCVGQYAANRRASKKPTEGKMKKSKKRKTMNGDLDFDSKVIKLEDDGSDPQKLLTSKKTKGFSWTSYLEQTGSVSAPSKLFRDPFPCNKNGFRVGMKMEGIDPRHPSLYCVLSVAEIRGYRVRLHFDGYSECYDFWTNADSPFLFPVGWVEKNGKKLQPPKGFCPDNFNWNNYLKLSKAQPAPKHLFTNPTATSVTPHGFRFGMKLEAVDKKNTVLTCVATVADVLGERILIHFDGWEDSYDYWCDPSSPYIHPVGWCQENGRPLSPPNDWPDIAGFTWEEYLLTTKSSPVPPRAFKSRPPHGFESGMALEAVDRRNPVLVRVGTVKDVLPHSFLLHFDGWSEIYDYWVDDDCPDNHPAGWCAKTGHPLQPPPSMATDTSGPGGCPTPGCSGIGHIKGAKYTGHYSAFGCPYSQLNMNKETALQDRLGPSRSDSLTDFSGVKLPKGMDYSISPEMRKCPTPNCDGSGHITGKYIAHHKISGCPLAEKNMIKVGGSVNGDVTPTPSPTKPLFGPGSGRGRKKHKLLKQYQQQKELAAAEYEATSQLHHGIHQSVFMSSMVSPPVKDLPLCWEQHAKLLPGIHKHSAQEVSAWNVHQVADFISSLPGCKDLVRVFLEEQIDGEAFLLLSQADIVNIMSIKLGPALKIYNSILMFKAHCDI